MCVSREKVVYNILRPKTVLPDGKMILTKSLPIALMGLGEIKKQIRKATQIRLIL